MFDIGFGQLLIVALVALIVLGPQRLPKAARLAGLWIRRARAQWYSVKTELERELAADELKRSLQDTREAVREVESATRDAHDGMRREFDSIHDEVRDGAAGPTDARPTPPLPGAGGSEAGRHGDVAHDAGDGDGQRR